MRKAELIRASAKIVLGAGLAAAAASARADCLSAAAAMYRDGVRPNSAFYRVCPTQILTCLDEGPNRVPHDQCLGFIRWSLDQWAQRGAPYAFLRDLPTINGAVVVARDGVGAPGEAAQSAPGATRERNYPVHLLAGPALDLLRTLAPEKIAADWPPAPAMPAEGIFPDPNGPSWGTWMVQAPAAWQRGITGRGVAVAVVDTGIACGLSDGRGHAPFAGRCLPGTDLAEARPAGAYDDNGHGTHVAGTIAGARYQDPKSGMVVGGVAPEATLIPVKVLDGQGSGSDAQVVEGIDWAVRSGAKILSMSLGGPHSEAVCRAVRRAAQAGVLVIAAAGNEGSDVPGSPADCDFAVDEHGRPTARIGDGLGVVVTVSAVDRRQRLAKFSNYGPVVDFAAPGVNIGSTISPGGEFGPGTTGTLSGTSMATPHVSGVAALAAQIGNPRAWLESAAASVDIGLGPMAQGRGLITAAALGTR